MGRSLRQGLEYFSVYTGWDVKMKLMEAKFGLEGIGFIISLWQLIYSEGYFLIWNNEETKLLFAKEHNIEIEKQQKIIDYALDRGIFSFDMYDKYGILTSRGIQKRYFEKNLKRTDIHFCKEFLLFEPELPKWSEAKIISDSKKSIFGPKNGISEAKKGVSESKNGFFGPKEVSKEVRKKERKKRNEASPTATPSEINTPLQKPPSGSNSPPEQNRSKPREQQLRELAERLKMSDPKEYKKLIIEHPELDEVPFHVPP